ncbi:hypothetical protein HELRODRAFT_191334 [Helobdella robusta]|uniref:C2 domain-containing protein n=1 Tax=Helobdella robusta TaxID=6412 RepID=T1FSW5_HELRO|nr:hypothetical protein HELRODRAFT_191334 [Helobdella robusta]ESO05589.1 hypothetical protein HELRODRAFT_191334 [Helobdella robusta]
MDGSRKDLESLKNAFQHSDPVPRFHYETRQFSVVHCCPELGDNDLEVTVVRGLNFNPPSGYSAADLHTYVRYEFPFPDTPQTGDTPAIKGTNSPEFNHVTKLEVNRKSRSFLRLLKSSKTFKMDVYYKRGFLKADKILGSVQIKLQPLEDKCIYHETYDLMEGRKAVGGKLEVKLRVRDPFVNKQVEEAREKWLVIDEFVRKVVSPAAAAAAQQVPQAPPKTQLLPKPSPSQQQRASPNHNYCISVLLYERDALEEKLAKYRSRMKPAEVELLKEKSNMMLKRANDLKRQVHEAGEAFIRSYISSLKQMSTAYSAEARSKASQPNNNDQVKVVLEKKALVDKELRTFSIPKSNVNGLPFTLIIHLPCDYLKFSQTES